MPKNMLWTEWLFKNFPIDHTVLWQQMLARFGFLLVIWVAGLLAYAVDGLVATYVAEVNVYLGVFGTAFMVLFGSYYVQRSLSRIIRSFRPMLKLDDSHFQEFAKRLERYSYSFFPCLLIALGFGVLTGGTTQFQQALTEGLTLHVAWDLAVNVLGYLLGATAIWMLGSIWTSIFLVSRQPLNVRLSPLTLARFRELSLFGLWFSLFYFLGVSIGSAPFLIDAPALSLSELLISPYLFFIAIGLIGILLPFYNIHITLRRMKLQELAKIADETEQLLQHLDGILAEQPPKQATDQTITFIARLLSLQLKEERVKASQEWPIDVSFLSKLVVLGFIPVISRIAVMLLLS